MPEYRVETVTEDTESCELCHTEMLEGTRMLRADQPANDVLCEACALALIASLRPTGPARTTRRPSTSGGSMLGRWPTALGVEGPTW